MWSLYKMGGLTPAITSMFDMQSAQQMAFIRSIMKEQRKKIRYMKFRSIRWNWSYSIWKRPVFRRITETKSFRSAR